MVMSDIGLVYRLHAAVGHSWHGVHEEIGVFFTPENTRGKKIKNKNSVKSFVQRI